MNFEPTKVPAASSVDRVKQVEDFLSEYYEIKINVFDPAKSFIVLKDKSLYDQEPTIDTISLHLEKHGIKGCDSILRKIIRSGFHITRFNPILDYIKSLEGTWKGESHIDLWCSYLVARDFGDKEEGWYQDRVKRLMKKWMAASIACSLGIRQNDAMLGFIHADEGIGKTYILEFITPKPLRQYYIKSDKDERFFNITSAFIKNFIVNFDECVGITNSSAEQLKKVLSSNDLNISNTFTHTVQRFGNGCFTSNHTQELGGFLTPSMGTRRFATIELQEIKHGYSKEVDVDQLWAEAFVLFKNANFNYEWDKEDYAEFKAYNSRYMKETQAYKLIKEYYRLPEPGEETVNKQPIEILQDLRRSRKLTSSMANVSEVTLGLALRALGFEHRSKRVGVVPRYGYEVVALFE